MMTTVRGRYPFTATQWQELEHQALIYKYMVTGMPVPADLLYTIRRSVDSSLSSKLILHQPHHIGWNCFQMGFGKKIDPEPGRCRRTDGKKWRCSKEAYPDSKYCVRHMHRGRNRSRKPVEIITATSTNTSTTTRPITTPPTAIPISSITKNTNYPSPCSPTSSPSFSYLASSAHEPHQYPFLYPHSSSSRPPAISLSSTQDHTPKFLLEPASYSRNGYGDGMKEEVDEHVFFSEASGTMRSTCGSNLVDDTWQLSPLKMGSPMCHLKQRTHSPSLSTGHSAASYLQLQSFNDSSRQQDHHQYYYHDVKTHDLPMKMETEDHQPKKVTHHFFDEWPPKDGKDSWLDSEDKFSGLSKTQLSISIPNPSQDFFITTNGKLVNS